MSVSFQNIDDEYKQIARELHMYFRKKEKDGMIRKGMSFDEIDELLQMQDRHYSDLITMHQELLLMMIELRQMQNNDIND